MYEINVFSVDLNTGRGNTLNHCPHWFDFSLSSSRLTRIVRLSGRKHHGVWYCENIFRRSNGTSLKTWWIVYGNGALYLDVQALRTGKKKLGQAHEICNWMHGTLILWFKCNIIDQTYYYHNQNKFLFFSGLPLCIFFKGRISILAC